MTRMKERKRALGVRVVAIGAILSLVVLGAVPALAVHDIEFQLEGNIVDNAVAEDFDWVSFFDGSGPGGDGAANPVLPAASRPGFIASGFKADYALPDHSGYATGTKDILPIGGWQCKVPNNLGGKFDIVNAYAVAYRNPGNNHLILYFASEISSPNGDRNAAFWFLKDESIGCDSPGGNTDWTGAHENGDILVVSAFTNGGTEAHVTAYEWVGGEAGYLDVDNPLVESGKCGDAANPDDRACAIVNNGGEIDPPWNAEDKDGGNLNVNEFMEGGIDLTAIQDEQCFATFVANSRSSQEPNSTLHDFAVGSLPTCGELKVKKYIDVDLSAGGQPNAGDVTSGAPVTGWSFEVRGPAPATTLVCSGTTNSSGELVCSNSGGSLENLIPGDYTVTEKGQTAGFFNTDPGPIPTTGDVSRTVSMGVGDKTVWFGNTCFVDKTWQISGVPSGTSITVEYTRNGGAPQTLTLSGSPTATGSVNDTFIQTDSIAWKFYITGDSAHFISGGTESLSSGAYPTCAKTNTGQFHQSSITGTKYKDAIGDGTHSGPGKNFTFELRATQSGAALQTTTSSNTDGTFTFPSAVDPGTYYVCEVVPSGWTRTEPSASDCRSVTVYLDSPATVNAGTWANTPLSHFSISFGADAKHPVGGATDATTSTISCSKTAGHTQPALPGSETDGSYSATGLETGTYTCTVVIVDP